MGDLGKILKENPGSLVFARYAEQLARAGDVEKAIKILEKGIASNTIYAPGYSVLAEILLEQGREEEAIANLGKAIDLDPQNPRDQLRLGRYQVRNRKPSESMEHLLSALRFEPDVPEVQNALREAEMLLESHDDMQLTEESEKALSELGLEDETADRQTNMDGSDDDTTGSGAETMVMPPEDREAEAVPAEEEDVPAGESAEEFIARVVDKEDSREEPDGESPAAEPDTAFIEDESDTEALEEEPPGPMESEDETGYMEEDLAEEEEAEDTDLEEDAFGALIDESLGERAGEDALPEEEPPAEEPDAESIFEEDMEPVGDHVDMAFEEEITDDIPSRTAEASGPESPESEELVGGGDENDGDFDALIDESIQSGELSVDDEIPDGDALFDEDESFVAVSDDGEIPGEVDDDTFDALLGESVAETAGEGAAEEEEEEPAGALDTAKTTVPGMDGLTGDDEEAGDDAASLLEELGIDESGDFEDSESGEEPGWEDDGLGGNFSFDQAVSESAGGDERPEAAEGDDIGAGVGVVDDEPVHEIDDDESYDPDTFSFDDDEPVLSDEERAELMALEETSGETEAVEDSEKPAEEIAGEPVEGPGDEDDLGDSLMGELSSEELDILSGESEERVESDTDLQEETREGIDYSDVLSAYGSGEESLESVLEPDLAETGYGETSEEDWLSAAVGTDGDGKSEEFGFDTLAPGGQTEDAEDIQETVDLDLQGGKEPDKESSRIAEDLYGGMDEEQELEEYGDVPAETVSAPDETTEDERYAADVTDDDVPEEAPRVDAVDEFADYGADTMEDAGDLMTPAAETATEPEPDEDETPEGTDDIIETTAAASDQSFPGQAEEEDEDEESMKYVESLIKEASTADYAGDDEPADEEPAAEPEPQPAAPADTAEPSDGDLSLDDLIANYERSLSGEQSGPAEKPETAARSAPPEAAAPENAPLEMDDYDYDDEPSPPSGGDMSGADTEDEDDDGGNVTATMAEIHVSQGLITEALGIYRIILKRDPQNERVRARIAELEGMLEGEQGI